MANAAHPLVATLLLAGALFLTSAQSLAAEPRNLSDADLIAYDAQPYDHAAMMGKRVTLGLYRGARVVAEFPCSDVCPDYTTRIVHLDVAPGAACQEAGGVTQARRVPFSIAMVDKAFGVPKPLTAGR